MSAVINYLCGNFSWTLLIYALQRQLWSKKFDILAFINCVTIERIEQIKQNLVHVTIWEKSTAEVRHS